jgi:hypothetical protein
MIGLYRYLTVFGEACGIGIVAIDGGGGGKDDSEE